MNRVVILTWISWSWKSSLQKELIDRGWKTPINYTTRKSRNDNEEDEYVFLSVDNFFIKLRNWDFLENTKSYDTYYAISKIFPEGDIVLVLDPAGREQVVKELVNSNYKVETYFLKINPILQKHRLTKRWDKIEDIEKRLSDNIYYTPSTQCVILEWKLDTTDLADIIENGH